MHEEPIQIVIATLTVLFLKYATKGGNEDTRRIMNVMARSVSLIVAVVTSVGIGIALDGTLAEGGKLIITFPSMASLALHTLEQFGGQEGLHHMMKIYENSKQSAESLAALHRKVEMLAAPVVAPMALDKIVDQAAAVKS